MTARVLAQANPFPAGGLPTAPEIWADRKDVFSTLKRTFDLAFAAPETMVIQVVGDYGSGKTHTLKHFMYLLLKGWGKIRTLPVFIDNPGIDNVDFYNRFLSALKMETVVSSLRNMLADAMLSRSSRLQKSRAEGEASGKDIVDALDQYSLIEEVRKSLIEIFREIGLGKSALLSDYWEHLATALSRLLMGPEYVYAAAKWLNFQRLYKSDREALNNIPEYEGRPSYTAACIAGMLQLIAHRENYDKVVLFIDELEATTEPPATSTGLASISQCFRELIDAGLKELVIVFGTSKSAEEVFSESQALLRRIHMSVKLNPLEPSDAVELVSDYLSQSLGREDKETFKKESIEAFNDAAKGKICNLIRILNLAYEMCIRNKWSSIDKEKTDRVLTEVQRLSILT